MGNLATLLLYPMTLYDVTGDSEMKGSILLMLVNVTGPRQGDDNNRKNCETVK